jgi:hypothetical protein
MTTATALPAVLIPTKPNSAISMVRALKNIKEHLEECYAYYAGIKDIEERERLQDSCQAAIDDVDVMLASIN